MKTIKRFDSTSDFGEVNFHFWQDEDGQWWTCRSGIKDGLTSESDDLGPFDSYQEAYDEQEIDFGAFSTQ